MRKTGLVSALLLSVALAVPSPALASVPPASPAAAPTGNDIEELDTFMDVYERVKARYVKDVDAHTLVKGAIDGMLAALDPHSSYAEGSDFDDLQTISDGDYGGLGLVTTIDGGFVRVVSTTEDAPAWKAGVKPKDFITHIDGMLAALDPHSSYAEGSDFDDLQTISDGDYGGLGLVTTIDGGFVRVVSTTEDAPAWKAGVKPKDFITHIDGKLLYGLSLDEATGKLRGTPGSKVQLTVRREGVSKPIAMTITRDVIEVKPVKWEVRKNVGIINLNIFNGKAGDETRNALLAINSATHDGAVGYILDLRSNGGGVVDEAVDIADLFLESGEIVSRRGRDSDSNQHYYARPGDLAHGRPVIVLVDSGTASASEIVAGALQDHHRALIVGEQSFGKGSVQSIYPMGSKRALRLTTELYYLPSGRSIQGEGIDPDIVVPQLSDGERKGRINVRESDLRRHLIADVPIEDADLIASDPVAPRFTVTTASLKSRGVADFQLDYALNILNRLAPPPNIADRRAGKAPNG